MNVKVSFADLGYLLFSESSGQGSKTDEEQNPKLKLDPTILLHLASALFYFLIFLPFFLSLILVFKPTLKLDDILRLTYGTIVTLRFYCDFYSPTFVKIMGFD